MPSALYCGRCLSTFEGNGESCPNLACGAHRPPEGWGQVLAAGDVLDRHYGIEKCLAVGGAGLTYLAREHGPDGQPIPPRLAIKVLYSARATGPFLRRLSTEATILQELAHPNIVELRGFVHRSGSEPYLVTRFEEGGSLAAHLERVGALSVSVACGILTQVLRALAVAHGRGVIHRDLKPDNVLLTEAVPADRIPRVRIADFGIAKIAGGVGERLTRSGAFVGTPEFAAPEQFDGKDPTPATDVFAAGALLVFLLTGQSPVALTERGDLEASREQLLRQLPLKLPELGGSAGLRSPGPDLGPSRAAIQRILDGTTALDPARRWSIEQVLESLAPLSDDVSTFTFENPVQGRMSAEPIAVSFGSPPPPPSIQGIADTPMPGDDAPPPPPLDTSAVAMTADLLLTADAPLLPREPAGTPEEWTLAFARPGGGPDRMPLPSADDPAPPPPPSPSTDPMDPPSLALFVPVTPTEAPPAPSLPPPPPPFTMPTPSIASIASLGIGTPPPSPETALVPDVPRPPPVDTVAPPVDDAPRVPPLPPSPPGSPHSASNAPTAESEAPVPVPPPVTPLPGPPPPPALTSIAPSSPVTPTPPPAVSRTTPAPAPSRPLPTPVVDGPGAPPFVPPPPSTPATGSVKPAAVREELPPVAAPVVVAPARSGGSAGLAGCFGLSLFGMGAVGATGLVGVGLVLVLVAALAGWLRDADDLQPTTGLAPPVVVPGSSDPFKAPDLARGAQERLGRLIDDQSHEIGSACGHGGDTTGDLALDATGQVVQTRLGFEKSTQVDANCVSRRLQRIRVRLINGGPGVAHVSFRL